MSKNILFISNGYAEDLAAIAIIQQLKTIYPEANILALPVVGNAKHFKNLGVKIIGPHWELPSQGVAVGALAILKDLLWGAPLLYLGQILSLIRLKNIDLIVGVGDHLSIVASIVLTAIFVI